MNCITQLIKKMKLGHNTFVGSTTDILAWNQTLIKPADLQINLEAKSKSGGQNGLIEIKIKYFIKLSIFCCQIT